MAQEQDVAQLAALLEDFRIRFDRMEQRMQGSATAQCSAEYPHPDRLVFIRGGPAQGNHYVCTCGMMYRKNGQGGLMEMV